MKTFLSKLWFYFFGGDATNHLAAEFETEQSATGTVTVRVEEGGYTWRPRKPRPAPKPWVYPRAPLPRQRVRGRLDQAIPAVQVAARGWTTPRRVVGRLKADGAALAMWAVSRVRVTGHGDAVLTGSATARGRARTFGVARSDYGTDAAAAGRAFTPAWLEDEEALMLLLEEMA